MALLTLIVSCKKEVSTSVKTNISNVLFRVKEVDLDGKVMITPYYNLSVVIPQKMVNIVAFENQEDNPKEENEPEDEGLPVIWKEVNFIRVGDSEVKCSFSTETESNVYRFEIEETVNQTAFKTVGVIYPKGSNSTYDVTFTP